MKIIHKHRIIFVYILAIAVVISLVVCRKKVPEPPAEINNKARRADSVLKLKADTNRLRIME